MQSSVKNLTMEGNIVLNREMANESGKICAGGIAGGNVSAKGGYQSTAGGVVGLLTNSTSASGDSSAPSVLNNSYATGSVTASDAEMQNNAGGAAGQIMVVSATNCWASGNVSASGNPGYFNAAGGFAGSII